MSEYQARPSLIVCPCRIPERRHEARHGSALGRIRERSVASRLMRRREQPSETDEDRRFMEAGSVPLSVVWLASGVLKTRARGEPLRRNATRRQPQLKV